MREFAVVPEEWGSEGIDTERPSSARMYDYYLGGAHNFAPDRQAAEQAMAVFPGIIEGARANRAFLRRAVEYLVDAGVRQFLDIGSGIPTVGHVHEVAQARAPESRVVFVDVDPVAVHRSRIVVAGNDLTAVVQEDIRRPERILRAPEVLRLFDLQQPVAVLVLALFHFISEPEDAPGLISRLTGPLCAGSYLVISHGTDDGPVDMSTTRDVYRRAGIELTWRTRAQVEALFDGFELVEPGVVWVPQWRPESPDDLLLDQPEYSANYGAVGRKGA